MSFGGTVSALAETAAAVTSSAVHPLDTGPPPTRRLVSFFEFWPSELFYLPLIPWMGLLALRHGGAGLASIANPRFPNGGLIGERKSQVFALLTGEAQARLPAWACLDRGDDPPGQAAARGAAAMTSAGVGWPAVAKPDLGARGFGVRRVADEAQLAAYLGAFPKGRMLILQTLVDWPAEAGVMYVRPPGAATGRIVSLTLKYFPSVVGDGQRSLRQLIADDPRAGLVPFLYLTRLADRLDSVPGQGERVALCFAGSHSKGALFRDGTRYVTPALTALFDRLADGIPEFTVGRFDVRAPSFAALLAGGDCRIIEVNGAGAEPTHIWDPDTSLLAAYRTMAEYLAILWRHGAMQRRRGHTPVALGRLLAIFRAEKALWQSYPPTE